MRYTITQHSFLGMHKSRRLKILKDLIQRMVYMKDIRDGTGLHEARGWFNQVWSLRNVRV